MQINYEDLILVKNRHKRQSIAYTSGCFDLLHRGHLKLLATTSLLADVSIVGVTPDQKIRKRKGVSRPIQLEETRVAVVDSIKGVDYSLLTPVEFPEHQFVSHVVLRNLRPDIFVTGEAIWENDREWLTEQGTKLHIIKRDPTIESTTDIITRMQDIL